MSPRTCEVSRVIGPYWTSPVAAAWPTLIPRDVHWTTCVPRSMLMVAMYSPPGMWTPCSPEERIGCPSESCSWRKRYAPESPPSEPAATMAPGVSETAHHFQVADGCVNSGVRAVMTPDPAGVSSYRAGPMAAMSRPLTHHTCVRAEAVQGVVSVDVDWTNLDTPPLCPTHTALPIDVGLVHPVVGSVPVAPKTPAAVYQATAVPPTTMYPSTPLRWAATTNRSESAPRAWSTAAWRRENCPSVHTSIPWDEAKRFTVSSTEPGSYQTIPAPQSSWDSGAGIV